jgi:hypothetical protein
MPVKRNETTVAENGAAQSNGESHEFEFRENPRVNAQIDDYIKQNPKRWAFIKSMSRERVERALVWEKVRSNEQRQKLNRGLFRKVEDNPAFKRDCEAILKHYPEDQRERVKARIARDFVLSQSREQKRGVAVAA